jgi:hypothetical protein
MVKRYHAGTVEEHDEGWLCRSADYDALAARLAEAVNLLHEASAWLPDDPDCYEFDGRLGDFLRTADSAVECRHDWVTDGFGPTACCKCGVTSTVNASRSATGDVHGA